MDDVEREMRDQENDAIQRERGRRVHTHPTGCPAGCDCQEENEDE